MVALARTTEPTSEPTTLTEAKAHLRVDHTADDTLITTLIVVARRVVENELNGRVLMPQAWDLYLDHFGRGPVEIPIAPVTAVTGATYYDTNNTLQVWDPTTYRVDLNSQPVRITPEFGKIYPLTRAVMNTIDISFTAGYADAAHVPEAIKQALLLVIGGLYDKRSDMVTGPAVTRLPYGVDALLGPYRLPIA